MWLDEESEDREEKVEEEEDCGCFRVTRRPLDRIIASGFQVTKLKNRGKMVKNLKGSSGNEILRHLVRQKMT